jgi:hypothetical protein
VDHYSDQEKRASENTKVRERLAQLVTKGDVGGNPVGSDGSDETLPENWAERAEAD